MNNGSGGVSWLFGLVRVVAILAAVMAAMPSQADITWEEDFETGWGLWKTDNGVWQVGTPSVGPLLCFGGLNCAETGLSAVYPRWTGRNLLSPNIQLPALGAGEELHLRYWQWVNYYVGDYGSQYISTEQDPVTGVWLPGTEIGARVTGASNVWAPYDIDLTAYANKKVQIQFGHYDDNTETCFPSYCRANVSYGRYIDNITIEKVILSSGSANLSLTMTASPEPVPVGGILSYGYTATNHGASTAHSVTLTINLSQAVDLHSTPVSGCALGGRTLTCPLPDLAAGAQVKDKVTIVPKVEGTLVADAQVAADESDPDQTDNSVQRSSTILPLSQQADLGLSVQDHPDPVVVGDFLTYTFSAVNFGAYAATGVIISADLPDGVSVTAASDDCNEAVGNYQCTIGDLPSAAQALREITVKTATVGTLNLSATIAATEEDPNAGQ